MLGRLSPATHPPFARGLGTLVTTPFGITDPKSARHDRSGGGESPVQLGSGGTQGNLGLL
jgi:hypothetical protein